MINVKGIKMKIHLIIVLLFLSGCFAKKERPKKNSFQQNLVQSILDIKDLGFYLHPEKPGRKPLVVTDKIIGTNLKLNKFGTDVKIISDKTAQGAFIRFERIECKDYHCDVRFSYPIEGITGNVMATVNKDQTVSLDQIYISEN